MAAAQRVRVMHFADVHLGVENYGRFNPETGLNSRLEDFTASLNVAVDAALDANVDLALFAGDAYKARDPNQTHQRAFAGALKRLTDSGVPVVMLIGNHDVPNTRGRAHALEIYGLLGGAGVTILARPEVAQITTRQGDVLVAGLPYLTRSRVLSAQDETRGKSVEEIAQLIREKYVGYAAELARECAEKPEHLAVLMGHFMVADARVGVQGMLLNPSEPQVPVSALALPQFQYVALGHVHKPQELNRGAQPPVVYCGSIDRLDFGERNDEKGFVLADIVPGHSDWKHVPIKTRRFLEIEIDASAGDDPTATIVDELAKYPLDGAVVRVAYKVSPERSVLVRGDEIRRALASASYVVAVQRARDSSETSVVRSRAVGESATPEEALAAYVDIQPRLVNRKEELLLAARPLFDALALEDSA